MIESSHLKYFFWKYILIGISIFIALGPIKNGFHFDDPLQLLIEFLMIIGLLIFHFAFFNNIRYVQMDEEKIIFKKDELNWEKVRTVKTYYLGLFYIESIDDNVYYIMGSQGKKVSFILDDEKDEMLEFIMRMQQKYSFTFKK